ncbi:hypothetical protein MRX96_039025 [Rhipicephalus microplus]
MITQAQYRTNRTGGSGSLYENTVLDLRDLFNADYLVGCVIKLRNTSTPNELARVVAGRARKGAYRRPGPPRHQLPPEFRARSSAAVGDDRRQEAHARNPAAMGRIGGSMASRLIGRCTRLLDELPPHLARCFVDGREKRRS